MASASLVFDIFAKDHASKTIDNVGKKLKGIATAAAVGAATGAAAAFAKGAISNARESIKVQKQTEAVLKSTGGQAGVTGDQIGALADRLSGMAGVDDELIQSGENVLLTFTKVRNAAGKGNDVFDQATGLALDMSKALGKDLQGSMLQVGKALQDPIRGMTALRRSGVNFTKQQQDQVKALVESGDTLGAQKIILKELSTEFGGSAAAQATSADKLKVAWENVQESLGKKLIPIFEKVANFLVKHKDLILPLAVVIGGVLVAAFVAWAIAATEAAIATFVAIAPVIAAAAPFLILAAVVGAVAVLIIKNWDTIKDAIGKAVDFVTFLLSGMIDFFKKIPGWIGDAFSRLKDIITSPFKSAFNAIAKLWNSTIGKLHFKIPGWVPGVGGKGFDVPDIPILHDGGTFHAPPGKSEGLALLADGETVIPAGGRKGDVTVNVDARGIDNPATVGEFTSRFIAWQLNLAGGL